MMTLKHELSELEGSERIKDRSRDCVWRSEVIYVSSAHVKSF